MEEEKAYIPPPESAAEQLDTVQLITEEELEEESAYIPPPEEILAVLLLALPPMTEKPSIVPPRLFTT